LPVSGGNIQGAKALSTGLIRLTEEGIRSATVAEIQLALERRDGIGRRLLKLLEQDERSSVRTLAVRERARWRSRQAERRRWRNMRDLEDRFRAEGAVRLAGVDEVGRGCLAGPVIAAAVILPPDPQGLEDLDDSKVLDADTRVRLREQIVGMAVDWAVASVDAQVIDQVNILEASMEAMRLALAALRPPPDHVLVDGNRAPGSGLRETTLIGGDGRSLSIAAASVVAKVHRDALMVTFDAQFPGYGFASHKGYASAEHRGALQRLGPCVLHRRSFRPVAQQDAPVADTDAGVPGTGPLGEAAAAEYLQQAGYEILVRGFHAPRGEIDLVARCGSCLVFVEVKTSGARLRQPEERVTAIKKRRLAHAARYYIERCVRQQEAEFRFDVVAVNLSQGTPLIEHIEDAFEV
jgi:ribonuclease HII